MSLPDRLKAARMTDATLGSAIDNEVGNLEKALAAILGVPIDTDIASALCEVVAAGLKSLYFQDAAADPTTAGQIRRNGATVKAHDGTRAVTLNTRYALIFGSEVDQNQGTTFYYGIGMMRGAEGFAYFELPRAGIIRRMKVWLDAVVPAGESVIATLRVAGADSELTVTVGPAWATGTDLAHEVSVAAGQVISVKVVTSAAVGTRNIRVAVEVEEAA